MKTKKIHIEGYDLDEEDMIVKGNYEVLKDEFLLLDGADDFCVILDTKQNDALKRQGLAREVINRVQKLRKNAGLQVNDDICVFLGS